MAILKLQNEGDSHTMTVEECEPVKGQYGMQVVFKGGGDALYLPEESANRQLLRCGYPELDASDGSAPDYDAVIGDTLTFSRSKNPKPGAKPYWNIEVASPADTKAKPAPKRLTHAEASGDLPGDPASDHNRPAVVVADAPEPDETDPRKETRRKLLTAYESLWERCAAFQADC